MSNLPESVLERLASAHPGLEIWWDSSPLVYNQWVQQMLDAAPPAQRPVLEEQLNRFYDPADPAQSMVRGCTTNPPLSLTAVKSDPEFWNEWIDDLIASNLDLDYKELAWLTYKEVVRRGAEMMLPIWEASDGRYGWISGQLDPRLFTEIDTMVTGADELRGVHPNVMVKVPGSTQGIDVLRILASKGISTNTTTCFTLPQILASARATKEGLQLAQQGSRFLPKTVDLTKWRAVITMMIGRLTENPTLMEQAQRRNIPVTWEDRHWLGIDTFQQAYRIINQEGYPSKMLACSMRQGPVAAGRQRFWDVEFLAGNIVYTCPPYVLGPLFDLESDLEFEENAIEKVQAPPEVIDKMMQIPYCLQSCDPNGMSLEQFNTHPATVATVEKFSQAIIGLEDYVSDRIAVVRGTPVAA